MEHVGLAKMNRRGLKPGIVRASDCNFPVKHDQVPSNIQLKNNPAQFSFRRCFNHLQYYNNTFLNLCPDYLGCISESMALRQINNRDFCPLPPNISKAPARIRGRRP